MPVLQVVAYPTVPQHQVLCFLGRVVQDSSLLSVSAVVLVTLPHTLPALCTILVWHHSISVCPSSDTCLDVCSSSIKSSSHTCGLHSGPGPGCCWDSQKAGEGDRPKGHISVCPLGLPLGPLTMVPSQAADRQPPWFKMSPTVLGCMTLDKFLIYFYFIWKEERQRDISYVLVYFPKCLQWLGICQVQDRSLNLHPGLLQGRWGPSPWTSFHCFSRPSVRNCIGTGRAATRTSTVANTRSSI